MNSHRTPSAPTLALAALLLAACSGKVTTISADGSGASRAHGSGASGSATGGQGASGTGAGGSGGGGFALADDCAVDEDCVLVLNGREPCASPVCSAPVAASREAVMTDQCLIPWEDRFGGVPWNCHAKNVECPAECAAESSCTRAYCVFGTCQMTMECPSCDERLASFHEALSAAQACDPALDSIQCTTTATVTDECGCPVSVNQSNQDAVAQAQAARSDWIVNCGGTTCLDIPCPAPGIGYCGSDGSCELADD